MSMWSYAELEDEYLKSQAKVRELEAERDGYHRMLYDDLGCRESCMGWVNERAESAEAKVRELKAVPEREQSYCEQHGWHWCARCEISIPVDLQATVDSLQGTIDTLRQERSQVIAKWTAAVDQRISTQAENGDLRAQVREQAQTIERLTKALAAGSTNTLGQVGRGRLSG